ncbi:MAG: DUF4352 domain-containing protein [Chloroflexi bacterium]|nr:DUF4352 domain-containing protein [Chloroflexota bacterium]
MPSLNRAVLTALAAVLSTALIASSCGSDQFELPQEIRDAEDLEARLNRSFTYADMEIVIAAVQRVDTSEYSSFNDANLRVYIKAKNVGSETRTFHAWAWTSVVDSDGVIHSPSLCAGCPKALDRVEFAPGGEVVGFLYFEMPSGKQADSIIFKPTFSANAVHVEFSDR